MSIKIDERNTRAMPSMQTFTKTKLAIHDILVRRAARQGYNVSDEIMKDLAHAIATPKRKKHG